MRVGCERGDQLDAAERQRGERGVVSGGIAEDLDGVCQHVGAVGGSDDDCDRVGTLGEVDLMAVGVGVGVRGGNGRIGAVVGSGSSDGHL